MTNSRKPAAVTTLLVAFALFFSQPVPAEAQSRGRGARSQRARSKSKVGQARATKKNANRRVRPKRRARQKRPSTLRRRRSTLQKSRKARRSREARARARKTRGTKRRQRARGFAEKNLTSQVRSQFVNGKYRPRKADFRAVYHIRPAGLKKAKSKKEKLEILSKSLDALAAETSTGTWTDVKVMGDGERKKLAPKIYEVKQAESGGFYVSVAYPPSLFEAGNVGQILATVAGDIFAVPRFDGVRLVDIALSRDMMRQLPGPAFGAEGIRKITGVKGRPILGSIFKPKMGFTPEQAYQMAFDAYMGGLDQLKDDEATTSQKPVRSRAREASERSGFRRTLRGIRRGASKLSSKLRRTTTSEGFKTRVRAALKAAKDAAKQTGEKKIFVANVTAPTAAEMVKRARYVKKNGGTHIMVDVLTSGPQALQTLREANLGLVIQVHRTGHAAVTRNPNHGISMRVYGKLFRAAGADLVAVGTPGIGKMPAEAAEVDALREAVTSKKIKRSGEYYLEQSWGDMKGVMPVVSGGLHPGLVDKAVKKTGKDVLFQFGGGTHGHPDGTREGAKALKQAMDASRAGVPVREAARQPGNGALKKAIDAWGTD